MEEDIILQNHEVKFIEDADDTHGFIHLRDFGFRGGIKATVARVNKGYEEDIEQLQEMEPYCDYPEGDVSRNLIYVVGDFESPLSYSIEVYQQAKPDENDPPEEGVYRTIMKGCRRNHCHWAGRVSNTLDEAIAMWTLHRDQFIQELRRAIAVNIAYAEKHGEAHEVNVPDVPEYDGEEIENDEEVKPKAKAKTKKVAKRRSSK